MDGRGEDKYIQSELGMTFTREKLKKLGFHKSGSVPLTCFKFTYQIMTIPKEIADLVQAFEYHRPAYLRGQERYNEAQLRIQFIDPFFRALGWDIGNIQKKCVKIS